MKPMSRRQVLRGMLGGALITVPLPFLPSLGRRGQARAAEGVFPTRFGNFNWGNGMVPEHWTPATTGAGWAPSRLLAPLARHTDVLSVVSGYEVKVPNISPHTSGKFGFLTGIDPNRGSGDGTYALGPTFDQIIAAAIGGTTPFRSIECGVTSEQVISWNGPNAGNPTQADPAALFRRLFGDSFRPPGSDAPPDPKLALRQSVLDVVTGHLGTLKGRLGRDDATRLEQHLDGIREIERRIAQLQLPTPALDACVPPTVEPSNPAAFKERHAVMTDLMVTALACDQTRVFTYVFSEHNNNWVYDALKDGHHRMTHDELGDQPGVQECVLQIMEQLALFLDALRAVPEGDGTLLDHCALLCSSDVSLGRLHALDEFPTMIAGGANGALRAGIHVRSEVGASAAAIPLTLMRAVGVRAASFGEDDCTETESIGELEA